MKFFIPDKSPEDAEKLYDATRKFAAQGLGGQWRSNRRHPNSKHLVPGPGRDGSCESWRS